VLAGEMVVPFIEQNSLRARKVVNDAAAEFRAVIAANYQGAHRVCAVINSKGIHSCRG
jgi:hypothetical protein